MENLSIEIGNRNIKTSKGVVFPSRYTMFNQIGTEIIQYKGVNYFIGNGEYDIELEKSKKDFMPLLLTAIAKSTTSEEINLVLGTPINQKNSKEDFIKKLKDKEFFFNYINKQGKKSTRIIRINKVEVILEGLGSIKYLPKEAGKRSILIDIGGWTTNVLYISNNKIEDAFTVPKGILSFYQLVKDRKDTEDKCSYKLEEIEDAIKNGYITDWENEKITIFNSIIKEIKNRRPIKLYDKYFTGGGSTDFKEYISKINCEILDNNLFTNVNGNLIIAEEKWRRA